MEQEPLKRRYRSYSPVRETDDYIRRKQKRASQLDQYFTAPDIAEMCVDILQNTLSVDITSYFDRILEPSYGQGAFIDALLYTNIPYNKIKYIDIDSKDPDHQGDFLETHPSELLDIPSNELLYSSILTIGNPPFGKRSELAIKFFNKAAKFSECIAFILPYAFSNVKLQRNLDPNFVLVREIDLSDEKHFIYQNRMTRVNSVYQIWVHIDHLHKLTDFSASVNSNNVNSNGVNSNNEYQLGGYTPIPMSISEYSSDPSDSSYRGSDMSLSDSLSALSDDDSLTDDSLTDDSVEIFYSDSDETGDVIPIVCPTKPLTPYVEQNDKSHQKQQKQQKNVGVGSIVKSGVLPQVRMIIGNLVTGDEKYSLQWRRKLGDAIKDGSLKINNCNIQEWLTNFKVLGKCSQSDTSVVLANTNIPELDRGVSLKISSDEYAYDNSLYIERGFYKVFFDFIQEQFFSPNIVTFYGSFTCSTKEFRKIITEDNGLSGLYKMGQILDKYDFPPSSDARDNLEILIIERTEGITLKTAKMSEEQWINVLFQIIYTFEVFNRLGLRHNDAHHNNIFIDDIPKSSKISEAIYAVDLDNFFKIDMTKMAKLFDLDLSGAMCDDYTIHPQYKGIIQNLSGNNLCENTKLQETMLCSSYGLCNDRNIYFDTFLTLGYISIHPDCPQSITDFILRNVNIDLFKTDFEFLYRLGKPLSDLKASYVPKGSMKTPFDMLHDPIFDHLKIPIENIESSCKTIPFYHLPLGVSPNIGIAQDENYWNDAELKNCYTF